MNANSGELPDPSSLVASMADGSDLHRFLETELEVIASSDNRLFVVLFLARIVSYADHDAAEELRDSCQDLFLESNLFHPSFINSPLKEIERFSSEVEPTKYAPDEQIAELSQVIQGMARIVNSLSRDDCDTARDVAQRLKWQRSKNVILGGIYGCCLATGRHDLAQKILEELRHQPESIFSHFKKGEEKRFYEGFSDLTSLATVFLKRTYLENMSEFKRMQEIPNSAFLQNPKHSIFVSHTWGNPNHPNDDVLDSIRHFVPNQDDIGIWLDYCCLPQKRRSGADDRNIKEYNYFKSQLQYIPTIILKSQMMVFWDSRHSTRAWCVLEPVLADILMNVVSKQLHHCRDGLADSVAFMTQTYNPDQLFLNCGPPDGTRHIKMLLPSEVRDIPSRFYNFVLNQLSLPPLPVTQLLRQVTPEIIGDYFSAFELTCTNKNDLPILRHLLYKVCNFAGNYDVTTIKWDGKISVGQMLPYIFANISEFSLNLIDQDFVDDYQFI